MKQVVAIFLVAAMLFALLPNGAVAFANESEGLESAVTESGSANSGATEDVVGTETEEASSSSSELTVDNAHPSVVTQGTDSAGAQNQTFIVTFDTNESLFFEVSSVEVKAGDKVVEPTKLPLKRGYKFLYWSKNGEKYDFTQQVNESFALRAEFQELEQKDGHGFEVYVVDAGTGEKMRLSTEVKMLELKNDNSEWFLMKRATFAVTPTVAEIEAALNGKKYLEIKEANITALGHFWGRTKDVEPNPLKVWNMRKTPATSANPGLYFDVRYADDADVKYYGQIEGGVIEIVVNTASDSQRVVSFDAGDAMQFEPAIVAVEAGNSVKEPARKPFKKGYKFLYWSNGGSEYDFSQQVNEHLELTAEFQELERKNGHGFEVYVLDAMTDKRVKISSEVTHYMTSEEKKTITEKRYFYAVKPIINDITFAIEGRKFLEVKEYNVKVNGHFATVGSMLNGWVPLMAKAEFIREIGHENGSYGFSVNVAAEKSDTMNGPHYGQVEGGEIEIVVNTEDNLAHLVQLELNEGVLFDKKDTMFYVDHETVFEKPIEEPLKRGYRFLGWFNGETKYDFDQKVTEPLTLTAKYEKIENLGDVKVRFELPDGTMVPLSSLVMEHEEGEEKGMPILLHTYRIRLSNEQIQNALGKKWLLGEIKEHKVEMWGRSGLNKGVAVPIRLSTNERKKNGSHTEIEFTILTSKEKAQIEGGIVTFVLDASVNPGKNDDSEGNVDFERDGSQGRKDDTVAIGEEETPLSNVDKNDEVLLNGEKSKIQIDQNGVVVVTEADLSGKKIPALLTFTPNHTNSSFVAVRIEGDQTQILPFSVYQNGKMHVFVNVPGNYTAKAAAFAPQGVSENHWAGSYIQFVGARKLMVGNEVGDFMPDAPTSRAMLTQILAGLQQVDLSKVTSSHYSDVSADKWYAASVNWATDNAIVSGIGENMFAPENAITREELAVMLHNFIKHSKWSLERSGDATMFQDQDAVADWAKEAVAELRANGLMVGKPGNLFDAKANVTRAEVAAVVSRLIELHIKSVVK